MVEAATGRLPERIVPDVPEAQVKAAKSYEQALVRGTGQQVALLQELLLSVFTHKICGDHSSIPAMRFLVFYSFRKDGSLELFNKVTRILSEFIYAGRSVIFNAVMACVKPPNVSFSE